MAYFFPRGTYKPPFGASVNLDHPFARKLLLAVLFQETTYSGAAILNVVYGSARRRTVLCPTAAGVAAASNRHGPAMRMNTSGTVNLGPDFIPTKNVTIACVRMKSDSTLRGASLFGSNGSATHRCGAHVPYSDSIVYFDFGGTGSPNRISVSGLSFSTTTPETWIFPAGDAGSSIWQNGKKVASQSTAISRTADVADDIILNGGNGGSTDDIQMNFWMAVADQWSDEMCRWWSAEPYAHLYSSFVRRSYVDFGGSAPPPATSGALWVMP